MPQKAVEQSNGAAIIGGGVAIIGGGVAIIGGGVCEVSFIVIVELVLTIGPAVDPVLKLKVKDSAPSVVKSLANVTACDPELFVIATDPPAVTAEAGDEKSVLFIVPDTAANVQYRVPVPNPTVVIVNVTDEPSFTEVVLGDIVYVIPP